MKVSPRSRFSQLATDEKATSGQIQAARGSQVVRVPRGTPGDLRRAVDAQRRKGDGLPGKYTVGRMWNNSLTVV